MNEQPAPPDRSLPVPVWPGPASRRPWRKVAMALAVLACLALSLLGGLLPVMPGWIFFVLGLYLLATEFRAGRRWVRAGRRRFPWISTWIRRARNHRWAPSHLQEFDDLTDPDKP
jgi:hypothetical protein